MSDPSFPMSVPPSAFNGAVNFHPSTNKAILEAKFKKNSHFTFREEDDSYVLVQGTLYHGILRVRETYEFAKNSTRAECWIDAKMVDHIKLTIVVSGVVETLELIRR